MSRRTALPMCAWSANPAAKAISARAVRESAIARAARCARTSETDRAASGVVVPFVLYEHMPQVKGDFDGRPARYNIDTGSRAEVTLTAPFVSAGRLRNAYPDGIEITDGWGVGGAFDRVGMWINLGEAGMTVMDLAAHGPAEMAGLKVDDEIIAIDGTAVQTRSLSDIRRSLKIAPVGRAITVIYSREGASSTTQVIPRNLITE